MNMKSTVAQLYPHEEVLKKDGEPLLIGRLFYHLAPDGGDLRVCGHPTDEAEVETLQGGDAATRRPGTEYWMLFSRRRLQRIQ